MYFVCIEERNCYSYKNLVGLKKKQTRRRCNIVYQNFRIIEFYLFSFPVFEQAYEVTQWNNFYVSWVPKSKHSLSILQFDEHPTKLPSL